MTVCGRVSCRFLVIIAAAVTVAVPCQAQSAAPATVQLPLVYSTTPMTRNADLMLSASILATAATDAGLAELSRRCSAVPAPRRVWRARPSWRCSMCRVVVYFAGLNHEWGHQTRATEYGVDSELSFTGTPWYVEAVRPLALEPMSDHPLARSPRFTAAA